MTPFNMELRIPRNVWESWTALGDDHTINIKTSSPDAEVVCLGLEVTKKSDELTLRVSGERELCETSLCLCITSGTSCVVIGKSKSQPKPSTAMETYPFAGLETTLSSPRLTGAKRRRDDVKNLLILSSVSDDEALSDEHHCQQQQQQQQQHYYISDEAQYYVSENGMYFIEEPICKDDEESAFDLAPVRRLVDHGEDYSDMERKNSPSKPRLRKSKRKFPQQRTRIVADSVRLPEMQVIDCENKILINKDKESLSSKFMNMKHTIEQDLVPCPEVTPKYVAVDKSSLRFKSEALLAFIDEPKKTCKPSHVICEHCGKMMTNYQNLCWHRRLHHGVGKPIKHRQCQLCEKKFAASSQLKRHMASHLGERNHLCDICGRGFYSRAEMRQHRRFFHEGVDRYHCEKCGYGLNKKEHLRLHRCGVTRKRRRDNLLAVK